MQNANDITETVEETSTEGLATETAPEISGLAEAEAPEGEATETEEAGDPSGEGEALDYWDLTDADLDSLPKLKRKKGETEEEFTLRELLEQRDIFGNSKQAQDLQALYRKLQQERPEIEKQANAKLEQYRQQVEPIVQKAQAFEQRLQLDPGGLALDILEQITPPELFHNIRQALLTPQHEGGAGYNPQAYMQQYQAQQAPAVQQQALQAQAVLQGDRALFQVAREMKLDFTAEEEQKIRMEAALLWNAGVRDPVQAARQAVSRLQKLGEIKAPKPAAVTAKPSLAQQIQRQISKPKTGARQTGTGGAPERRSRALEIAAQIGGKG